MKPLFVNFFKNPVIYQQVEHYWKRIISSLVQDQPFIWQWINTFLPNGKKMYDANPIVSAYFPNLQKGIRIIQESVSDEVYPLKAWLHTTEYQETEIVELVMVIQLSKNTRKFAEQLMKDWICKNLPRPLMTPIIRSVVEQLKIQNMTRL